MTLYTLGRYKKNNYFLCGNEQIVLKDAMVLVRRCETGEHLCRCWLIGVALNCE